MLKRPIPTFILSVALASGFGHSVVADPLATNQTTTLWQQLDADNLKLRSKAALVTDHYGHTLFERDADTAMPIASITKLMTAMVTIDAGLPMDEPITIDKSDRDLLRLTGSRLQVGATLTRGELLTLALMASENRAALALGRTYPGGIDAIVRAMNSKAKQIGMLHGAFVDPAGLDAGNVASARGLARMVLAAMNYSAIKQATTRSSMQVKPWKNRGPLRFVNTNRLVRNGGWEIQVSKTGYINEAGRCLVMHVRLEGKPTVFVLLNSYGKLTPFGDANRVRKWVEQGIDNINQHALNGETTG